MYLVIKNKNINHDYVQSLNGGKFSIAEDSIVTENFNEELDSATIILSELENEIEIEQYDYAIILDNDGSTIKYRFCVNSYTMTQCNLSVPNTYKYEIQLFSETKLLEGVVLPNLTITKNKNVNRTIFDYIQRYIKIFSPKIKIEHNNSFIYKNKYNLNGSFFEHTYNDTSRYKFSYNTVSHKYFLYRDIEIDVNDFFEPLSVTINHGDWETESAIIIKTEKNKVTVQVSITGSTNEYNNVTINLSGFRNDYSSELINKFNVECPEMQWNQPTLREVINDLMMVKGCIPIMKNNLISFIDLSKRNSQIDNPINYSSTQSKSFEFTSSTQNFSHNCVLESSLSTNQKVVDINVTGILGNLSWKQISRGEIVVSGTTIATTNTIYVSYKIATYSNSFAGINYVNKTQNSDDYATELQMEAHNVIGSSESGIQNTTDTGDLIGLRNESDFILNTKNGKIYTKYPIYNIKHLWMYVELDLEVTESGATSSTHRYYTTMIDLCNLFDVGSDQSINLVAEEKVWQTKTLTAILPAPDYGGNDAWKWSTLAKYKNFYLHYSRSGREIEGLTSDNLTKQWWFLNKSLVEIFAYNIRRDIIEQHSGEFSLITIHYDLNKDFSFRIEYETFGESKFKAGRWLPYKNEKTVVDNQTNSYINVFRQGKLEYQKVNRLGNQQLLINARYTNINDVANLADVYKDSVIYKREISFNKNYLGVNYVATQNYILRDYFTGIKAKIRSWKIAEGSDATTRNELKKYYYEFSFNQKNDESIDGIKAYDMLSPLMSHLNNEIFLTSSIGIPDPITEDLYGPYFRLDLNNNVVGNSLVFTLGFDDNTIGAYTSSVTKTTDSGQQLAGYPEEMKSYTDGNGEQENFSVHLFSQINYLGTLDYPNLSIGSGSKLNVNISDNIGSSMFNSIELEVSRKTILSNNLSYWSDKPIYTFKFNNIYKDNKEIMKFNIQLEYCSDTEDIVMGEKFIKDNRFVSTNLRGNVENTIRSDLKVYYSDEKVKIYDENNLPTSKTLVNDATLSVTNINNNSAKLTLTTTNTSGKAYYITDNSDNVLLAWNDVTKKVIFLNRLMSRDTNIYDFNGNITGDIIVR